MNPYQAFIMYIALKRHFTSKSYDYVKYHGKVRINIDTFEKRKDKFHFGKLSKMKDPFGFLLSNMIIDPSIWVGNLFSQDGENNYTSWQKRNQSLSYLFKQDIERLDDDFRTNFVVDNGQYPLLYTLYLQNDISIETLIILNKLFNFFDTWDTKIEESILWPDRKLILDKYSVFVNIEHDKFKHFVIQRFT